MELTPQDSGGPSPTTEVHLGPLLELAADAIEEHVELAASLDIARALKLRHHPDIVELARMTDQMLTHCATLAVGVGQIPVGARSPRGAVVLETWTQLKDDGPADGPLGPWSYTRHLALAARDMLEEIHDHRRKAAFTGRPGLPPLPPGAR
ncbi:hypothetical protein EAO71_20170 [Streptomyces sp. ms191]|nr:hypothetical protein EAO71_20170 [Streptomyces sp. ms191]